MHVAIIAALSKAEFAICMVVIGILALPVPFLVHCALNGLCMFHVRRYCASKAIKISAWRIYPLIGADGIKTEKSCIDVLSAKAESKIIYRFIVWAFGVTTVSEIYEPESPNITTESN